MRSGLFAGAVAAGLALFAAGAAGQATADTQPKPPTVDLPVLHVQVVLDKRKLLLPPGPNGPVGVVWIDLSKPHYGIHVTSAPHQIGRAESHGCIRLTNWDAARLALMVKPGTLAIFRE